MHISSKRATRYVGFVYIFAVSIFSCPSLYKSGIGFFITQGSEDDFPKFGSTRNDLDVKLKHGVRAHVEFWNQQPSEVRYHIADKKYPFSRSCMCYAQWFDTSQQSMCRQLVEQSEYNGRQIVNLAITDKWFREHLCVTEDLYSGILNCLESNCHFTLVQGPHINYTYYDGLLQYSGDIMPPFSKPLSVPWFQVGYIGAEPEDSVATVESYRAAGYDIALSYNMPNGMLDRNFFHTMLVDLPEAYFSHFKPRPWLERKLNTASVISHCVPERSAILDELSRHIQYGRCGKNKDIENYLPQCHINRDNSHNLDERRWIEQRCIISHYKFYLAFENSQHIGYVTEKLWQALVMGSIPIYWGAPDVVKYLPDPDAIINVSHFDTIEELAKYIRSLLVSSHAYEKHMMWRKRPLPASFRNIFNDTVGAAACRLCDHIAMKKQSK